MLEGWTDYPFTTAGDIKHREAPIRRATVIAYDGDKYCVVRVDGVEGKQEIKAGYVYRQPGRAGSAPCFSRAELEALPRTI